MKIARTDYFKTAWSRLEEKDKKSVRKAIENLVASLRVKKIKGTNYIWEARASRTLRITFQVDSDIIILRNVGHHDETLKQP
jgi:mRNA-degrading endonuclease RelE of RelBE toxin-antitoxin system